jgi:divalent metal cation (Fe/Co/Zn/Cd) transporter
MSTEHSHHHHPAPGTPDIGRAHDHGTPVVARVRHALSEVFGAHSHDVADQVDEALEADTDGRRALLLSLAIFAATAIIQAVVVVVSGSVALLGDTLHNVADALTAVPLLIAFRLALRPATKRYTYGYGRAEDLAGIFVIAMIALSSALAAYEAIDRLLHPRDVTHLWAVAAAAVVGFTGNELVARYRMRIGRRIGSAALVADGLHARTDGFTSLAVLLGAGGVALGWSWADPVIGLATAAVTSVSGIDEVRELRIRWIGHTLRAEVDATVAPDLTLTQAHDLAHHAEAHLLHQVRRLTAATVHTSPAGAHTDHP